MLAAGRAHATGRLLATGCLKDLNGYRILQLSLKVASARTFGVFTTSRCAGADRFAPQSACRSAAPRQGLPPAPRRAFSTGAGRNWGPIFGLRYSAGDGAEYWGSGSSASSGFSFSSSSGFSFSSSSGSSSGSSSSSGWLKSVATALVFTQFDDPDKSGVTRERRMYDLSREELLQQETPTTTVGKILAWFRDWLYRPFRTFLRFIHLLAIFLPVMVTAPAVFIGPKESSHHGERAGALWWYHFLRLSMEWAGPSFIKLGQWAASRTDIFSGGLCDELGTLHSNAKRHSFSYTRKIVSVAAGRPLDELFSEFDKEPIGVGAMGQVYRARLRDGDKEVAVKVLHPHIDNMVDRDLAIMTFFARAINAIPTMEWLSLPGEVETFGIMMRSQLDLRIEAENLRIFQHNFAAKPDITFPTPFPDITSRHVLIEELVKAVSMEKILKNCNQQQLDHDIAGVGVDAFLKMLLLDNFTHADLHPGNIFLRFHKHPIDSERGQQELVETTERLLATKSTEQWNTVWTELQDDGYLPQVCFIDAGLVTELTPTNRRNFIDLFKAIATFDGYRAGELMVARSRTPETAIDPEVFALRTQRLVDQVKRRTFALGSVKLGDLLTSMLEMVRTHHVRMESEFITVVLSILLLEGIGRQLNPDLDLFKAAIPVLRQVGTQLGQQEGLKDLSYEDIFQMGKVWLTIEVRQFIQASVEDIHNCVKYDRLSPNH